MDRSSFICALGAILFACSACNSGGSITETTSKGGGSAGTVTTTGGMLAGSAASSSTSSGRSTGVSGSGSSNTSGGSTSGGSTASGTTTGGTSTGASCTQIGDTPMASSPCCPGSADWGAQVDAGGACMSCDGPHDPAGLNSPPSGCCSDADCYVGTICLVIPDGGTLNGPGCVGAGNGCCDHGDLCFDGTLCPSNGGGSGCYGFCPFAQTGQPCVHSDECYGRDAACIDGGCTNDGGL